MPVDQGLLLAFVVTTFIAMIVPGPDMLFVLGCGLRGGPKAGLLATCGVATSEAIHVLLAAAGLTALFAAFPAAFTTVRVLGGVYLVYLGVQAIRKRGGLDLNAAPAGASGMSMRKAFVSGFVTNLFNPKMVVFTVALLPQFVRPELGSVWAQFPDPGGDPDRLRVPRRRDGRSARWAHRRVAAHAVGSAAAPRCRGRQHLHRSWRSTRGYQVTGSQPRSPVPPSVPDGGREPATGTPHSAHVQWPPAKMA